MKVIKNILQNSQKIKLNYKPIKQFSNKDLQEIHSENIKQTYIQEQQQKVKERENAHEHQLDLSQILKPAPLDLKFEEDKNEIYAQDYTESPTVFKFNQQSQNPLSSQKYQNQQGLTLNTDSEFQVKDNALAMKVLSEGKIDLADKRINVQQLNISDQTIFGDNQQQNNIQSIDLGNIVSNKKDSILLEDIDVFNIPEDKDIILNKKEKKMQAIGIKVKKQNINDNTEQQKQNQDNTQQQNQQTSMAISQNIFEEKDLQEHADEDLFQFEKDYLYYDWSQVFRTLAKFIPLYVIAYYFIESCSELYATKHDIYLMEEQELQMYQTIKKQNTRNLLLNDKRFDRKTLLQLSDQME